MWKSGPQWLQKEQRHWPDLKFKHVPLTELKTTVALKFTVSTNSVVEMFKDYLFINKLKRRRRLLFKIHK